ncbi:nucleoid-associated protein [Methylobacterium sp. J-070]|uniref:nucleoid-associated protein n=1 Tax=Methylobacterium sp. J-070 TaxID=2836650 RepID=UPI001FB87789|nr:nucleoid-associated protein [Methylobacterium sp. J-070]MCJ2050262.1 nucleoid-associated protein [Methylobacterium sp. J-070]
MIFHVVGKSLEEPILLDEISPPQHQDFFLERVKSSLRGNLFAFRERSATEALLREIASGERNFTECTQALALDFQSRHKKTMSVGVFFIFELAAGDGVTIYALIKYDNEDVVRYVLEEGGSSVPRLERFQESFVRKPEAMQKIALVRLDDGAGGRIMVRDRSNTAHISDYFEGFLQARRVNDAADMSEKLAAALKDTLKANRDSLPEEIQRSGVNRIYEVLRQGPLFDPGDCEPLVTACFGVQPENSKVRRDLDRNLRNRGVSEETFDVSPERIQKPRRHRMETVEGVQVTYDEDNRPAIRERDDGRQEIVIVTAGLKRDDADIETGPRRG